MYASWTAERDLSGILAAPFVRGTLCFCESFERREGDNVPSMWTWSSIFGMAVTMGREDLRCRALHSWRSVGVETCVDRVGNDVVAMIGFEVLTTARRNRSLLGVCGRGGFTKLDASVPFRLLRTTIGS